MRVKIDENLHEDVAGLFARRGHDAQTVHDEGLQGVDDIVIAEHCRAEGRTIVTLDLDFGDIRTYPPQDYTGIIVLRVADQSRPRVLRVLQPVLDLLEREPISGRLWVVTDGGIRIRGGSP